MKRCLACGYLHSTPDWHCPECGCTPDVSEGIVTFAARQNGGGIDADYRLTDIAEAEERHFWFRGRRRLVVSTVQRSFPNAQHLLDVGCGTGFVLDGLRRVMPSMKLAGCDARIDALRIAQQKMRNIELFAADVGALPYSASFDVVTMLDVLEHVDDDRGALEALFNVLKPGGGLILTVPQHPWLWSEVDEFSRHRQRYVKSDLKAKVRAAGFEVIRCTSLFAVTLPLLVLARLRRRRARDFDPAAELRVPRAISATLGGLVAIERLLIRAGVSLPVGSSLLVIARRPLSR